MSNSQYNQAPQQFNPNRLSVSGLLNSGDSRKNRQKQVENEENDHSLFKQHADEKAKNIFIMAKNNSDNSNKPGACQKCGYIGHLSYQCMNGIAIGSANYVENFKEGDRKLQSTAQYMIKFAQTNNDQLAEDKKQQDKKQKQDKKKKKDKKDKQKKKQEEKKKQSSNSDSSSDSSSNSSDSDSKKQIKKVKKSQKIQKGD